MRVVIVGAGLAGLSAAIEIGRAGHEVTVLDKGRSPGGRMATRRIGSSRLDHGAQFFTVRSDEFAEMVRPHLDSGLVYEWCRGFSVGGDDGFARYAVRNGMNALPKTMAHGLDVRCEVFVFAIRRMSTGPHAWDVAIDDGTSITADAVVMTCPLPQTSSLLMTADISVPDELRRTDYDRTMALLVTLDRASTLDEPGGLQHPTHVLSFVSDNQRKGISDGPALTIHANAEWSEANWDLPADVAMSALVEAADGFIGDAQIVESQLKKWRFATPRAIWPEPCWAAADTPAPIVIAGDAFAGPKVEGAVLSGLAAARVVLAA